MSLVKNIPALVRERLRERDGDNCHICGEPIDFLLPPGTWMAQSIEHVIPRAAGGTNDLANLRLAHQFPCNRAKGALYEGTDYARNPVRRVRQQATPRRRMVPVDPLFESWSAARS